MPLYALSTEPSDIQAEFDRLGNIADGTLPGFISPQFKKEDLEKLDDLVELYKKKYDNKHKWGDLIKLALARANLRDGLYMLAGRKYMYKVALTKKSLGMVHKGAAIKNAEKANSPG